MFKNVFINRNAFFSSTALHFLKFELRNRNPFVTIFNQLQLTFQTLDFQAPIETKNNVTLLLNNEYVRFMFLKC